jgi:integrase
MTESMVYLGEILMAISNKLTERALAQMVGPRIVNDGNGLYLKIRENGKASWLCRVRHPNTRKLVDKVFGHYPSMSIREARASLFGVKKSMRDRFNQIEVSTHNPLFRDYAERFIARKEPEWKNQKHIQQWRNTLRDYAFPIIGDISTSEIETRHLLLILEPIWAKKTVTGIRVRQRLEAIIDGATVEGYYSKANPARWKGHLCHLLPDPNKIHTTRHQPSMPISAISTFYSRLVTREAKSASALCFLILTACRQSEVRNARWDEFDFKSGIWTIPADRMKTRREHRVPLTEQMTELLNHQEITNEWVFLDEYGNCFGYNTFRSLMHRMNEINYVPHGFRSTFRDWCSTHSTLGFEVFERALAHRHSSATVNAYARSDLLEQRRVLMQEWNDFVTSEC